MATSVSSNMACSSIPATPVQPVRARCANPPGGPRRRRARSASPAPTQSCKDTTKKQKVSSDRNDLKMEED